MARNNPPPDNPDPAFAKMCFYVIRNQEGKYFRSKGYNGYGQSWVDDPLKAKVYNKLGQARSRVTFFATTYPTYGRPVIVAIHAGKVEVLDEEARVKDAMTRKKEAKARREIRTREWQLKQAQRLLQKAKADLDLLRDEDKS